MGALTGLDDLVNRLTGGNSGTPDHTWFFKMGALTNVIGRMTSLWTEPGQPALGAAPGAVAVPTNATNGSLLQADPGGSRQKWLVGCDAISNVEGTLLIYDRLLHISGLNGTTTTAQNVQTGSPLSPALTRYTDGAGNIIFVEVYTQVGSTGATGATVSYKNQAGSTQTSASFQVGATGMREAGRLIPVALASGDTGVQGVASITLGSSTGTAGDFGITVAHPLATIPFPTGGIAVIRDLIASAPAIVEVKTGACIAFAWMAGATTAAQLQGSLHMVEA